MDIETLIYVVLVAVYIMVAVVRKVAKKNIDAIKTQERPTGQRPTAMPDPFTFAPSAPDPFAMSNDAEHDGEEYIPTPTAFEKARRTFEMLQDDVFADMPSAPSFTEEATTLGREHFAAADEPTLYPGYSYKPIDIPEPMAEDESPLPLRTSEVIYASKPPISTPISVNSPAMPRISAAVVPFSSSFISSSSREIMF